MNICIDTIHTDDHHMSMRGDEVTYVTHQLLDPTLNPKQLGAYGEQYAAMWLQRRGYRILDRNWQTRYGEIDVVAMSPEGTLLFVEVKTRRSALYGVPQEAVTSHKRLRLRRASVQWLLAPEHRIAHNGVRFDVIAIIVRDGRVQLRYIPEAF
ncbi:endonuclease [Bifidobacterium goeldii]|uniref:UPF0102 protein D2E25_0421 n=2 Tax=Bifidobacterium goeldii TaxID=2306975 RepID=A0A430FMH6_9BIFI|nr:endonuclease [Bifidobacterium goeldii]